MYSKRWSNQAAVAHSGAVVVGTHTVVETAGTRATVAGNANANANANANGTGIGTGTGTGTGTHTVVEIGGTRTNANANANAITPAATHTAARTAGVTLVELLVVLTLAGILLGAAAPAYQQMIQRQQLRAVVTDLVAALDLTRSQAIARGRIVLLAPLDAGGVDWRGGWIVFVDANGNRRPDLDETAIFQRGPLPEGVKVGVSFSSKAPPAYVAYNGAGRTCSAGNSLAARFGTLSLALGDNGRNIKINMLGRVRVCDPAAEAACTGASE